MMAAKAFSEQERESIRLRLLVRGRELFSRQGLKKTSVADLTQAVGIAQGSFYLFFHSKEDLFFAVLEEEEKTLREQIFSPQVITEPLTRSSLKKIMLGGIQLMMENPLTRRLWTDDEFKVLLEGLPPQRLAGHFRQDAAQLTPLIEHWQSQGQMIAMDPEIIAGAIGSLYFVSLHGEDLGEKNPQVLEFLIDCIVQRLIAGEGEH